MVAGSPRGVAQSSGTLGYNTVLAGEKVTKFLRDAVPPSSQYSNLLGLFDLREGRAILP